MIKNVEIPDNFIDEMKIEAIKQKFPTFKAYLDSLIEKEGLRVHDENNNALF
jgi:hypothetical protein